MFATLADVLAANASVHVNCAHPACCHSVRLDVRALVNRLGADHGAMHDDLVGRFRCSKCDAEQRAQRPVYFTFIPDYTAEAARRMERGL